MARWIFNLPRNHVPFIDKVNYEVGKAMPHISGYAASQDCVGIYEKEEMDDLTKLVEDCCEKDAG